MKKDLQKLVIREFSSENAQRQYMQKALEGLWDGEHEMIDKYFTAGSEILDMGCGTGRTTIPLHKLGYIVIGVDLIPAMIENAKAIAKEQGLQINYRVGDATNTDFQDNTFDSILFSNQGWTQIPGHGNRMRALNEMERILKPGGLLIFTTHQRIWLSKTFFFWLKQWIKQYLLKPLGLPVIEQDFGDRFFDRETSDAGKTFKTQQFIHIPSVKKVKRMIQGSGMQVMEINKQLQISNKNKRKYPPVFYICKK